MKAHIDGFYVAAEVRFLRQTHKGTIIIVEGETDHRVLSRFIDEDVCDTQVGLGKDNVLEALDLLEDEGFPGVLGVVDADFDRIVNVQYDLENLCITDLHDLDLTIFATAAFDRYIVEHADRYLLETKFNSNPHLVRKKIIEAALPLACCRLASKRRNLQLYFKDLRHDVFVSEDDLSIDDVALVAELISRSNTRCTTIELTNHMTSEAQSMHDPHQLASGHDAAAVLGVALRRFLGKRRPAQTWASEIEAGLRLAFDWEGLLVTKLYRCLNEWEARNAPYRIFRPQPA